MSINRPKQSEIAVPKSVFVRVDRSSCGQTDEQGGIGGRGGCGGGMATKAL